MAKFIRGNEEAGEEIVDFCREMAKKGMVEITKDDSISFKCKAGKRLAFEVNMCRGVIFTAKEITVVTDLEEENWRYDYLFLDKTGIDLNKIEITWKNNIGIEMGAI